MYSIIIFGTLVVFMLVTVYFFIKFAYLQLQNIIDGADDRTPFFFSFVIMLLIGMIYVGVCASSHQPTSYGKAIMIYMMNTFMIQMMRSRCFGYPTINVGKRRKIFLNCWTTVMYSLGTITTVAVILFSRGYDMTPYIDVFASKDDILSFYEYIITPTSNGFSLLSVYSFLGLMVPMYITYVIVLLFDKKEGRSKTTLVNDLVLMVPIALLSIGYFVRYDHWLLLFFVVISVFSTVFLHLHKESTSIEMRRSGFTSNIKLVETAVNIMSKKETLSDTDEFQIEIIAKKLEKDIILNDFIKLKKHRTETKRIYDMILSKKDELISEEKAS
jgi:hypothetical protein